MAEGSASSYATGGGGVRLEHQYAAVLLSAVLAEDPISELGDDLAPERVRLQASDISEVDDVVVEGHAPDGLPRRVSIGVRRNPKLQSSDTKSVPLVKAFLKVVTTQWDEVSAGRWRVGLAVGVPSTAVQQTGELAGIAQAVGSGPEFRDRAARTSKPVSDRLDHLDSLVAQAAAGDAELEAVNAKELTWRWLSALTVRQLRLEGVDRADRTVAVSAIRRVVSDGSAATADAVFAALAEQSGLWAAAAARVDQALLRRALSGFALGRSASYTSAWSMLDGLGRRLREGIRPDLAAGTVRLELDRGEERGRLVDAMRSAGRSGSALVVTGEPDVGKSSLTLRAAEQLAAEEAAVTVLSLRDLPAGVTELEHQLGGPVADVLAAGEVRPVRLLVVDGAESVLEGRRDLLRELATAAMAAGIGVIAVTRTDGAKRVGEILQNALPTNTDATVAEHTVARLLPAERQQLVDTFRPLIRLSADARAQWLVGRPGLVDVLLRAGTIADTTDLMSEADVFAAVWTGLVLNNEEYTANGVAPHDREQAVLAVARRSLGLPPTLVPGGAVWAELRSDGVLRTPANAALSTGDEFASDLIRDLALCRLFLIHGWAPLHEAGAPRWTIRAVRLACQAKLLGPDRVAAWRTMRPEFETLGEQYGDRWEEVPVEALLPLGDARGVIEQLWADLDANSQAGLKTLLRLAELRYTKDTFGDPFILAPVVAVTFCGGHDLGQNDRHFYPDGPGATVRKLVLAWLRGMARDSHGPDPVRQQVRDRIHTGAPAPHDEFTVEALAMLGPDTDERTEQWLRDAAATSPYILGAAIESPAVAMSMSATRPHLLLELAEAYYIEHPDRDDPWGGPDLINMGVRSHHHGPGVGFGVPFAAWYYGPFTRLLHVVPVEALAMINRIVDHAARVRVSLGRHRGSDEIGEATEGFDIDLPGIGPRRYVGDRHVWAWYRGAGVGPYPCMSALLAVEQFADHLIGTLNLPVDAVVRLLLRECGNLAMPGLVVGLLIRHQEKAADLLDPWLAQPWVWTLEHARSVWEGQFHVGGADSADTVGAGRRQLTPRDVVAQLTVHAVFAEDQSRLDTLSTVADQLIANARTETAGDPQAADRISVVEGWASTFSPANYRVHRSTDGTQYVQYEPPAQIVEALATTNADLTAGSETLRLQHTYFTYLDDPDEASLVTLTADIALARQFAENPPEHGPLNPQDPVAATAAAALLGHCRQHTTLGDNDLRWAISTLLTASTNPHLDPLSHPTTMIYPMAADRAAAKALPALLLPPLDHLRIDTTSIDEALNALATSRSDEVRTALIAGCAPVWAAACTHAPEQGGACGSHGPLWDAVQAGIGECRLGPWDHKTQSRTVSPLPGPHIDTLPSVPAGDLQINQLTMPIACTADARKAHCITSQAAALLPVLLDAHRRAADHWATQGYGGYSDAQRETVARVLIDLTVDGQNDPLVKHLQAFADNANAFQQLLTDLATLFTYDPELRRALPAVWPLVLKTTLDAVDAGADLYRGRHWGDYAVASLLPTPRLRMSDTDPDTTLAGARADWITPDRLETLFDRWVRLAAGEPKAADAIAQYAMTTPTAWQATTGLDLIERIIGGRYDQFANRVWFVSSWLGDLREATGAAGRIPGSWQRTVDGLAGAGDSRAVGLQQIDE